MDVDKLFNDHITIARQTALALSNEIKDVCDIIAAAVKAGNKVLLFGNGGSAADAQHIAAEFTGRFLKERRSLPAVALTTDTSAITAIANDYGYDHVFERQTSGLAVPGDVLIGISTSGNSNGVINALKKGKEIGCINIGLSGRDGGAMTEWCDINLVVPGDVTARIQEMHILIGHIICEAIDDLF